MKKTLLLLAIPLMLFAGIRNVQFSSTDTSAVVIKTNTRIPTLVRFEEDIHRVYLGAPSSWIVKVIGTTLVLRPKEKVSTGITVELASGVVVPLRAKVVSASSLADDLVNIHTQEGVIVQKSVEEIKRLEEQLRESLKKEEEAEEGGKEKSSKEQEEKHSLGFAATLSSYNFAYSWKNKGRLRVKAVFDDGVSTYIVYEKGSAVGAVYLKEGRHSEVVNFVIQENVCRVDRTLNKGEEFLVVYGKDKVKIKRKKR